MPNTVPDAPLDALREIAEIPCVMAKADLRKTETLDVGPAIARAAQLLDWSLDRLAREVGKDARQVSRWVNGTERAQFDALFAVVALRHPLIQALGELVGADVEVTIRLRRSA